MFLWLGIHCFKLNFQILLQLNISSFEKSIFKSLLDNKTQILVNLLSFSFWHAFSLFSLIFNYFLDFLDFQQAWINFMVPNDGTHKINSCKINWALVRARHPWYLLWYWFKWGDCLIFDWFWFLSMIYMRLFIPIVELTLFPIEVLSWLPRYALYHLLSRILWICMLLWATSMLDSMLECLDVCLICSDEMHVACHIPE